MKQTMTKLMASISRITSLTAVAAAGALGGVALGGEPIYVQPGQCVMVGSQQVCAMKADALGTPGEITYACRYSEHKGGELPGYKTYGLVKIVTKAQGASSEILIKDFGLKGKDKCDDAAEDRKKP